MMNVRVLIKLLRCDWEHKKLICFLFINYLLSNWHFIQRTVLKFSDVKLKAFAVISSCQTRISFGKAHLFRWHFVVGSSSTTICWIYHIYHLSRLSHYKTINDITSIWYSVSLREYLIFTLRRLILGILMSSLNSTAQTSWTNTNHINPHGKSHSNSIHHQAIIQISNCETKSEHVMWHATVASKIWLKFHDV